MIVRSKMSYFVLVGYIGPLQIIYMYLLAMLILKVADNLLIHILMHCAHFMLKGKSRAQVFANITYGYIDFYTRMIILHFNGERKISSLLLPA